MLSGSAHYRRTEEAFRREADGQTSLDPRVIAKLIDEETARSMIGQALRPVFGLERDEDCMKAERAFPLYEDASPINHLKAGAPPVFLYYTNAPKEFVPSNTTEAVHDPHVVQELLQYPGAQGEHGGADVELGGLQIHDALAPHALDEACRLGLALGLDQFLEFF
ncbi:MAG: hypothetical protein NTW86_08690 [Candidatus Sumerlaeota bacterium]|nr:hypothetical protein [Candidatus Sumerlaeota bacterium]